MPGSATGTKTKGKGTTEIRINVDGKKTLLDDSLLRKVVDAMHQEGMLKGYMKELNISYDDEDGTNLDDSANCGHCNTTVGEDGISCQLCFRWFCLDEVCSGVNKKFEKLIENKNIWYVCDTCLVSDPQKKGCINTKIISNKLEELKTNADVLTTMVQDNVQITKMVAGNMDVIQTKIDDVDRDVKTANTDRSYAEALKTKKALVIKSADENVKVGDDKKNIMSKITVPVEEVKTTKEGHLFVRFADRIKLEEAKDEFEKDNDLVVNEKGKLKPKIKVVYVSNEEEDIINTIKMKNPWLDSIIQNEDDFKVIKEMNAKNANFKHYIIKCTPTIRKAIHMRSDKLYTLYSTSNVYDYYMPYQCYKCQEFGHNATKCNNNQTCAKCSGNHHTKSCTTTVLRCNNCVRKGHSEVKHRTNDASNCMVYKEEIARARNNTDHGFD